MKFKKPKNGHFYHYCYECRYYTFNKHVGCAYIGTCAAIGKDEAAARKDQLRALHGRFDIDRKIYRQHQQIERSFGGYHRELETCGCEHCEKMLRLIDGREIPE